MQSRETDFDDVLFINYVDLKDDERLLVYEMRNHPEIRRWMYQAEEISLLEHLLFIENLKKTDSKLYFLVKKQDHNVGTINFNWIDCCSGSAKLGLYVNPFEPIKGHGRLLEQVAERYACDVLKLNCLHIEVYSDNKRAHNLYKKQGYLATKVEMNLGKEVLCMQKSI